MTDKLEDMDENKRELKITRINKEAVGKKIFRIKFEYGVQRK